MEWITLGIAIIGLGLSIYNAYIQRIKDKRRIKVIIEFVDWVGSFRIIIVNTGIRPVTILNISANLLYHKKVRFRKKWVVIESVPGNVMPDLFPPKEDEDENQRGFPITLKDGEYLDAPLYGSLQDVISTENHKLEFYVYDAEGNKYTSKDYRIFDAKYNFYQKVKGFPQHRPDPHQDRK